MLIRMMAENDYDEIRKLVCQVHRLHVSNRADVYNDIDPLDKPSFNLLLKDTNTFILVAESDHNLVGFCEVSLKESSKNPLLKARRVAWIEDLCIDKNYRERGIGKALFYESKRLAKSKGFEVMELMVWSFNEAALNFYENVGMKPRSIIMELTIDKDSNP